MDGKWFIAIAAVILVGVLIFFSMRNKKKQAMQQTEQQNYLKPGATVMTIGGLIGKLVEINDSENTMTLEVLPDGQKITFSKGALYSIMKDAFGNVIGHDPKNMTIEEASAANEAAKKHNNGEVDYDDDTKAK